MNIFQFCDYRPLNCHCGCIYKGIAFDSCHFYLSCPEHRQIYKCDTDFNKQECFTVCRSYGSICFDRWNDCFWALCVMDSNHIYRLDRHFNETDCLIVQLPEHCSTISGIDCYDAGRLLICGTFGTAIVQKFGGCCTPLINPLPAFRYQAIAVVRSEIIAALDSSIIMEGTGCGETTQCQFPSCYKIEDMALCQPECGCLYILLTKNCRYPYILRCSIQSVPQNSWRDTDKSCHCSHPPQSGGRSGCRESANEIIQSIALVEAALSHIINAEGEKIQGIIRNFNDPDQIFQVNETVNKTITSITHLEQILYGKMQIAYEICKGEKINSANGCTGTKC